MFEDDKRLKESLKRIRQVKEENEEISLQLTKAQQHIKRLRAEKNFLLEEIEDLKQKHNESDSDMSASESIMSEVKGRKPVARKKRDPNAPKGPGNVFFIYCRMERDNIKDEAQSESLGEVTRLLGQKWKALTMDEKQKYYDVYKKELDEYEEAMKIYNAGITKEDTNQEEQVEEKQEQVEEEKQEKQEQQNDQTEQS